MRLLRAYIGREVRVAVLFVLAGFLALFTIFDFLYEIEDVGRGGYRIGHAFVFVLLGLPSHFYELMPVATLIGAVYAMAQFASNSEFTAMRAAGLGRRRALASLAVIGIWLAVLTAAVGEFVAPAAERLAQSVRFGALGAAVGGQLRSGIWIKDALRDPNGELQVQRFVNIGELDPDGSGNRVRVFEFDAGLNLLRIIEAERATWQRDNTWIFDDVKEIEVPRVEADEEAAVLGATRSASERMSWRSELSPSLLSVLLVDADRMSAWNLYRYISYMKSNQQDASRYEIALWKKIVYPFAVLVMLALALPSAYMQARAGGVGFKVFAAVMLGIAFHFLNGLFSNLGLLNTWPAWISVSLPSFGALVLALGMLAWVDRAR
ncbi:MAG: LPS export ABC transporter permease LptG [Pseudomonadota bacterium]|nr:LPS export ABC transporter permease LptG [Pseudomonadota bacterium]